VIEVDLSQIIVGTCVKVGARIFRVDSVVRDVDSQYTVTMEQVGYNGLASKKAVGLYQRFGALISSLSGDCENIVGYAVEPEEDKKSTGDRFPHLKILRGY